MFTTAAAAGLLICSACMNYACLHLCSYLPQRYRKQLELQVEETKTRRMHEDMNDTEFRLNSDIVKKLEADRHMASCSSFHLALAVCSVNVLFQYRRICFSKCVRATTTVCLLLAAYSSNLNVSHSSHCNNISPQFG